MRLKKKYCAYCGGNLSYVVKGDREIERKWCNDHLCDAYEKPVVDDGTEFAAVGGFASSFTVNETNAPENSESVILKTVIEAINANSRSPQFNAD